MSDLMEERYGTSHPRRRTVIVVATTVLAIVFLGWVAWVAWFQSDPAIEADVASYRVVSAHQVDVKLQTRFRDDQVQGSCLLRATARDHTIVGELNVTAAQMRAANGDWIPVRTERKATTVEKVRCTAN